MTGSAATALLALLSLAGGIFTAVLADTSPQRYDRSHVVLWVFTVVLMLLGLSLALLAALSFAVEFHHTHPR